MILVMRTYNFINKLIRDFFLVIYNLQTVWLMESLTEAITFLLGRYL